jgi:hypothetical protein
MFTINIKTYLEVRDILRLRSIGYIIILNNKK